jgi:hypothetical protein
MMQICTYSKQLADPSGPQPSRDDLHPFIAPTCDTFQSIPLSTLQFPVSPLHLNPSLSPTRVHQILFTSPSAWYLKGTNEAYILCGFDLVCVSHSFMLTEYGLVGVEQMGQSRLWFID